MPELAARAYFTLCLALGQLLRSARYSAATIVRRNGGSLVRKHRRFYAPVLVWLGGPMAWVLDTGVRVLPQREWADREQLIYRSLRGMSVQVDADGVLVLPHLTGRTLAAWLDDPRLEEAVRRKAIEQSVIALTAFHGLGFTHGDAMADNVLVDLDAGIAHWFDFETVHDAGRAMAWQRADDVRALLTTCLVRTPVERYAATLGLILDVYADDAVTRALATSASSVWRRSLTFHLAQAPVSLQSFLEIGRLLRERSPR